MISSSCSLPKKTPRMLRWLLVAVFVSVFSSASKPLTAWWQPGLSDHWKWQLQLQGNLKPIDGVNVYAVDADISTGSILRAHASGAKVMCYISAGSAENWRGDFHVFPQAVIGKTYQGWPGEWWLDIRRLDLLAPIMRARIKKCRDKGFDVLDPDNINGYENDTGFDLTRTDAVRYIRWLADEAHRQGLALSLKNGEALIREVADVVDMMQSESCYYYDNCREVKAMTDLGKPVFAVEYRELLDAEEFHTRACEKARKYGLTMIYRDRGLAPGGTYESCALD